jgi:restriction endonuclease Mrr
MNIAVQCKRWKDKAVGNNELIKLYGGKRAYKCIGTLFISTSSYTNAAKDYSESVGMRIWNGAIVKDKIGKWQKDKSKKICYLDIDYYNCQQINKNRIKIKKRHSVIE